MQKQDNSSSDKSDYDDLPDELQTDGYCNNQEQAQNSNSNLQF